MPTFTSGAGTLLLSLRKGESLVIRNLSGTETVTGSTAAREDATVSLGSGVVVYGPQTSATQVSITTTGALDYSAVMGDPSPNASSELAISSAKKILRAALTGGLRATMASPPAVTVGSANAASTINSATTLAPKLLANSPLLRKVGGWTAWVSNAYLMGAGTSTGGTALSSPGAGVVFMTDAPDIDFSLRTPSSTDRFRVYVDDQLVTSASGLLTTNGDFPYLGTAADFYYVKLAFGSSAPRKIEIRLGATTRLVGMNYGALYSVWRSEAGDQPLGVVIGDSYVNGTGTDHICGAWPRVMAELLGCDVFTAGGSGTGYITTTGGIPRTYRQRVTDLSLTERTPDFCVIAGGFNDYDKDAAALRVEVALMIQAARAQIGPGIPIFVLNSYTGVGRVVSSSGSIASAIRSGFADAAVSDSFFIDNLADGWIDDRGKTTATTGLGNGDIYMGSDGIHPVQLGHNHIAQRAAQVIKDDLRFMTV